MNLIHQCTNALNTMDALSNNAFKKMFCIDRNTFNSILENKVTSEVKAFTSSSGPIPLWTKLAVFFIQMVCYGLEAIVKAYSIGFPIGNHLELEELSHGFSENFGRLCYGDILLDSTMVKVHRKYEKHVCNELQ
jgi:hypothetical protein